MSSSSSLSRLSPAAQKQLLAEALAEAARRVSARQADQARGYQPRGAAAALREYRGREVLLSGPAGTGKSRGVLEWINALSWQYPGLRTLIARKTRASLAESTLYTFEEHVLPTDSPLLEGPQRQYRHGYDYPTGSQIILGGLDKPTRLFSTEYDIIFVPEAIEVSLNDWESLLRALRHNVLPWQQLIGDTNPDRPQHWLKQRSEAAVTKMLESRHEDNPVLWDAERGQWTEEGIKYIAILDGLTGVRKERLRYGRWVQAEGAVYEMWDDALHVIDPFPIPAAARRWRVIDFGYTNPFVCQWWFEDADGRLILYREIYMTQRTVKVHAAQINDLSKGETYQATIADHDAEDRATLRENGIYSVPAQKEVTVGIQKVQERLKKAGDGKPRLFVFRDALVERDESLAELKRPVCTKDEFTAYVWPKAADGKLIKEAPVKEFDHGMDDVRYLVMHIDSNSEAAMYVGGRRVG